MYINIRFRIPTVLDTVVIINENEHITIWFPLYILVNLLNVTMAMEYRIYFYKVYDWVNHWSINYIVKEIACRHESNQLRDVKWFLGSFNFTGYIFLRHEFIQRLNKITQKSWVDFSVREYRI